MNKLTQKQLNKLTLRSDKKIGICFNCGKEVICNQPHIDKGILYLVSEDHGCGSKYQHILFCMDLKYEEDS